MNSQARYDARIVQAPLSDRDLRVLARKAGRMPQDLLPPPANDRVDARAADRSARLVGPLWIALAALLVVWAGLDATMLADGFDPRLFALVNIGLAGAALSQLVAIRRTRPVQARSRAGAAIALRAA